MISHTQNNCLYFLSLKNIPISKNNRKYTENPSSWNHLIIYVVVFGSVYIYEKILSSKMKIEYKYFFVDITLYFHVIRYCKILAFHIKLDVKIREILRPLKKLFIHRTRTSI